MNLVLALQVKMFTFLTQFLMTAIATVDYTKLILWIRAVAFVVILMTLIHESVQQGKIVVGLA